MLYLRELSQCDLSVQVQVQVRCIDSSVESLNFVQFISLKISSYSARVLACGGIFSMFQGRGKTWGQKGRKREEKGIRGFCSLFNLNLSSMPATG